MTQMTQDTLQNEIAAFEKLKVELLKHHFGKFVVIRDGKLAGAFDTLDNAAKEAIQRFGKGHYLIRQVGKDAPTSLPASVAFRPLHASY